jgi:para-aminobenzoate synthetase component I
MFINRTEIIDKINHFSGQKRAFLFAIDFNGEIGFVLSPDDADYQGLKYDIGNVKNIPEPDIKKPLMFGLHPVGFTAYKTAFDKVMFHLKRGDTYLLNLTFPTSIRSNHTLSEIFGISRAPYRLFVPGHFAVFSPEAFIRAENDVIYSFPMKGTIDAGIPEAEHSLLSDQKELFEHNTIVDLIRNDLSMVSTRVTVNRLRYIDRIKTNRGDLLQMSSAISGQLSPGYREKLGQMLFALLPAGSVTGAPKEKTVEIIRATESYERGFYTGVFGSFDGSKLVSAVSIRYIEQTRDGLVFKSGGGITALSEPEKEYQELIQKVYVPVV